MTIPVRGLLVSLGCVAVMHAAEVLGAGLGGSWSGQVTQSDPPDTYPVEMELYGSKGSINYPSLGCGGTLELMRVDGKTAWYRERLTSGKSKCIDGGTVQMKPHALGDARSWEWRWEGSGVTVRGVLNGSGKFE